MDMNELANAVYHATAGFSDVLRQPPVTSQESVDWAILLIGLYSAGLAYASEINRLSLSSWLASEGLSSLCLSLPHLPTAPLSKAGLECSHDGVEVPENK